MSRTVEDDKHMPWKLIVFSILLGVFFSILPFPYWALWLIPEVTTIDNYLLGYNFSISFWYDYFRINWFTYRRS